jgi:two-component sensor histidine kinase
MEQLSVVKQPRNLETWSGSHLRMALESAGVALWSWNVDTDNFTMDEHAFVLWDLPFQDHISFEDLSSKIHPADLHKVRTTFASTRGVVGTYEIDFRILIGEAVRWISARGQGDEADAKRRIAFGIFLDITERKQAEEAHELLAGEMSHRVKNLLSMASALTSITSRSVTSKEEMVKELTNRLAALGRAHDAVRPVPGQAEEGALLGDLITIILAPYDDMGAFGGRIRVSVPRMSVGEAGATALAIVFHELATNSMKYGALSAVSGTLNISCAVHEHETVIIWTEAGGPPINKPAELEGFGSKLLMRIMTAQLNGSVEHNWTTEGVVVTLKIDNLRLAR